jgi:multidrug efflux pump subunit AcrB
LVSAFTAWWALSVGGLTVSFLPGSSASSSEGGTTITETYAHIGIGTVGGMYEAILALAIIAGALAIVAGLLGLVAGFGRLPQNRQGIVRGLVIAAIVVALVAVVLAPAMQPWAIKDSGNKAPCSGFNGTSPCNAFWGSVSANGTTNSWGAATGWYLALAGSILAIVGLVLWGPGRAESKPAGAATT